MNNTIKVILAIIIGLIICVSGVFVKEKLIDKKTLTPTTETVTIKSSGKTVGGNFRIINEKEMQRNIEKVTGVDSEPDRSSAGGAPGYGNSTRKVPSEQLIQVDPNEEK